MEKWKIIQKAPRYEVSNLGRVKNTKTSRIIKNRVQYNTGYEMVTLAVEVAKPKTFKVHRLVAEAFCENFKDNNPVDHIDRNRVNNSAKNLRCITTLQNAWNRGLSVKKIEKIIRLHEAGYSPQDIMIFT